jgi:hypothetical protein
MCIVYLLKVYKLQLSVDALQGCLRAGWRSFLGLYNTKFTRREHSLFLCSSFRGRKTPDKPTCKEQQERTEQAKSSEKGAVFHAVKSSLAYLALRGVSATRSSFRRNPRRGMIRAASTNASSNLKFSATNHTGGTLKFPCMRAPRILKHFLFAVVVEAPRAVLRGARSIPDIQKQISEGFFKKTS